MIRRVVVIKLKDAWSNPDDRAAAARHTHEVLEPIDEVRTIEVSLPADPRSLAAWDLCLTLTFDDLDAAERYREDRRHRAYVDVFLRPMLEVIKVWNFDIRTPDAG